VRQYGKWPLSRLTGTHRQIGSWSCDVGRRRGRPRYSCLKLAWTDAKTGKQRRLARRSGSPETARSGNGWRYDRSHGRHNDDGRRSGNPEAGSARWAEEFDRVRLDRPSTATDTPQKGVQITRNREDKQ